MISAMRVEAGCYEARFTNRNRDLEARLWRSTRWLRRWAGLPHAWPFSSTYATSRLVATSRYRPTTQPQANVLKPRSRTRLIMLRTW